MDRPQLQLYNNYLEYYTAGESVSLHYYTTGQDLTRPLAIIMLIFVADKQLNTSSYIPVLDYACMYNIHVLKVWWIIMLTILATFKYTLDNLNFGAASLSLVEII